MFARTSTWSGSPEALQKWADNAVSTVKGFVEGLRGNAGVVFLIDRDGGTALTVTLWDSDEKHAHRSGRRQHRRGGGVGLQVRAGRRRVAGHDPAAAAGVHSRGQLVAAILQRDYLPHVIAGDPLSPSGAFVAD